jgi:hypothetical protein
MNKNLRNLLSCLFLAVVLFTTNSASAEGTREVSPSSTAITSLGLLPNAGNGSFLGCIPENRIYFHIEDHVTENFYYGFRWTAYSTPATGGVSNNIVVYMRIYNSAGVQQGSPIALPTSGAGFIPTYAQAKAGPNIGSATPTGYTPSSFNPTVNGDYYIELYQSGDGGATASNLTTTAAWCKAPYWDLTVAKTTNVQLPGRVYCQKWSFVAINPTSFVPEGSASSEAFVYGYTKDSAYIQLDIRKGFKPIAFNVAMNEFGVENTGNWGTIDRKSKNSATAPALQNGFKCFLNVPDSLIYPYAPAPKSPTIPDPPLLGCAPNGPFSMRYQVYKDCDVFVLLDLNGTPGYQPNTKDRLVEQPSKTVGIHEYVWDGIDGLGGVVPAGTQIGYQIIARNGRTNFPVYDAEINDSGFVFQGIKPQATASLRLYWDDRNLVNVGSSCASNADNPNNVSGIGYAKFIVDGKVGPAHAWSGNGNQNDVISAPEVSGNDLDAFQCNDFGNVRAINTWCWAVEVASTTTIVLGCVNVSGTVINDANNSANNTFNNINTGAEGGTNAGGLFALLIDSVTNTVIASVPVDANGNYTFTGVPINITAGVAVQISSTNLAVGSPSAAATTPAGWDVTTPETRPVTTGTTNVTGIDFGIQQAPVSSTSTAPAVLNPGGTGPNTIPPTAFTNSDQGPGIIESITLTTFPTNATSITINGTTYTSGSWPVGGVTVPTNAAGDPLQPISVDPASGASTVALQFTSKDDGGLNSGTGTLNIPFVTGTISGNVLNDVNGVTNNTVNGAGSNAGGLNAVLVDNAGNVVAVAPIAADGSYSFSNLDAGDYNVVLSTASPVVGSPAPASSLPAGWISSAENNGTGSGTDGTADGKSATISLTSANPNTSNVNFGIQELPTAASTTLTTQLNPGGTLNATVPANSFGGTDLSGGTIDSIRITSFPSNATTITINGMVYTSSTFPAEGITVVAPGGVPTNPILVDPEDGNVTVAIPYVTKDNSGAESATPGVVSVQFNVTTISGNVFNDTNGNNDNIVNGIGTDVGGLNALLVDDITGNIVASVPVNSDGTYTFPDVIAGTYKVVLSTTPGSIGANAPASSLPAGWQNTGENNGTASGNDGSIDGTSASFTATTTPVSNINFGLNQPPTANSETAVDLNPTMGNEYTVASNLFGGTDPVTNTIDSIRITSFPANADSIIVNGITYTSASFPSGGISIPTNAAGEPLQTIQVDPIDGTTTVTIPYVTIDAAGATSAPGEVIVEFLQPIAITGQLINDANNSANNTLQNIQTGAEQGTSTDAPMYAYLVDPVTNNILQIDTLNPDGTYVFSGITQNTDVKIVLSPTPGVVGNTAPAAGITPGWVNTSPLDTTFNVGAPIPAIITGINFGAQQPPSSGDTTLPAQLLPAGTDSVLVPATAFVNDDASPGNLVSITISSLPANATSITVNGIKYDATYFLTGNLVIPTDASGNPTQTIAVDPVSGATNVVIDFVSTDNGGQTSATPGSVTIPFITGTISGNVFNDVNGTKNNLVDGAGTDAGGLFAILVDNNGDVVQSVAVDPSGTYNFTGLTPGDYTVVLSTTAGTPNTPAPAASLPSGWNNTAEHIGTTTGNDGTTNGISNIISLNSTTTTVTDVNFGIQQPPTANTTTLATQTNPGGSNSVAVPANSFGGTDVAAGTIDSIRITTFPSFADTLTINGIKYTSTTWPANGVTIEAPGGVPNVPILVDPQDGAVTVPIAYYTKDNAGMESVAPGLVNVPFNTAVITGNVFDDANGMTNNTVDGTGTNAGGLNAVLLNDMGEVIAVAPIAANGTYTFTGLSVGNYNVVVTADNPAIGSTNPVSTLPSGYVSTGENIGTAAGYDGTTNGVSATVNISATTDTIKQVNFAIEQPPYVTTSTAAPSINPGGVNTATVAPSAFTNSDYGTGTVDSIRIVSFPTNATSITINGVNYTSTSFPSNGVTVPVVAGVPNAVILVDPIDGAVTVAIPFKAIDNANQISDTAAYVNIPFTTASVDGQVFNDLNGSKDNLVNGSGTDAGGLFANLIDADGNVVQTTALSPAGTYTFNNVDGGDYTVVISTTTGTIGDPAPASSLPSNWVNTAENNSTAAGNDGTTNGASDVFNVTADVTNINFGIQQLPTPIGSTAAPQLNPYATTTASVPANIFSGTDPNGGAVDSIRITSFPANATTIIIDGMPYNSGNFPSGGVTIAAPGGVPSAPILVDPIDGEVTVAIPFKAIDNAGFESTTTDTAKMPFVLTTISGTVFNDVNGATDNEVNGTPTNAGGTLYAILLNDQDEVVATTPIAANGTYTFTNVAAGDYKVAIDTSALAVGTAVGNGNAPAGWVSTGENNGTGPGIDALVNGLSNTINVIGATSITDINFGIEQKPTADTNAIVVLNPQFGNTYPVPSTMFGGADAVTNTITELVITTFPSNCDSISIDGTFYTFSTWPSSGVVVPTNANGEPTVLINVDPIDGDVDVDIIYVTVDEAGVQSTPGLAKISFLTPIALTGQLINDADNSANGTLSNIKTGTEQGTTAGSPVYAYLVDPVTNTILQVDTLQPNGTYGFGGIAPNADVKVLLSTTAVAAGGVAPVPSIPAGWVATSPLDTTFNVGSPIPAIVTSIDFGAQQPPNSDDSTLAAQPNPNGTNTATVPSAAFKNDDAATGTIANIIITKLPVNATSITVNGTLYDASNFPSNGIVVPTLADGTPTQTIEVDPIDGQVTVEISFVSTDNGGLLSDTGKVKMPFAPILSISGNVFEDVNALSDNTVNGSGLGAPNGEFL